MNGRSEAASRRGRGRKLHSGLWKIPPRLLENPTQGKGSTQAFGKSHPGFWKSAQTQLGFSHINLEK